MGSIKKNFTSQLELPLFGFIAKAAEEIGQPAYVIGGWVRDLLLERPSKDIDIVTVGSGIELAKAVAKQSNRFTEVSQFKNFGTAMIKFDDYEVEFVGARRESYSRNSRKPVVEDGTLQDDQNRRDFTINALSIGLNRDDWGKIHDPFDGLKDLENKTIRTPLAPGKTYSDDPLRMMRAIRFASQLNFKIDADSYEAIAKNKNRIKIISKERISTELNKILLSDQPSVGLELLYKTGLLEIFFPELVALSGVEEIDGQTHKENFYHTLEVVDNISRETDNLWLRYAALLHDIGKPVTKRFDKNIGWTFHGHEFVGSKMVPKIFKRLKLPLDDKMKYVKKLVALSSRPIVLATEKATDSGVRRLLYDAGNDVEDLMTLCEADVTTKSEKRKKRYLNNFKVVRKKLKEVEEKDHVRNFQPPVDGKEIIKRYNLQPGKEIGKLKNAVKEAILDGQIQNDYDQAIEFLDQQAMEMGLLAGSDRKN